MLQCSCVHATYSCVVHCSVAMSIAKRLLGKGFVRGMSSIRAELELELRMKRMVDKVDKLGDKVDKLGNKVDKLT
jgi:hypothetical protein